MAGTQKSVRWEPWVERAVKAIADEKGKTFSWMANYLVELKLNDLDLTREMFEPGMEDLAKRAESNKEHQASDTPPAEAI